MLQLPHEITHIYTLYFGVQCHGSDETTFKKAVSKIECLLAREADHKPIVDSFVVTEGYDIPKARVWAAYWTAESAFRSMLKRIEMEPLWHEFGSGKHSIGIWSENFITPVDRLETNYARTTHKPGVAQIPGSTQPSHNLSAYWGAGRDRIPASASDLFHTPKSQASISPTGHAGIGERLTGTNYDNMAHIRSGQWWVECPDDERQAYEDGLQQTLMTGMRYLWEHPAETGTIGLRFLQNVDSNGHPIKETCGAGFFRNWADLELWSSTHPSHLAIFTGAHKHAQQFGEDRKFMTWHEVSILKAGEAQFDYVNCDPNTGVIQWVKMRDQDLIS